MFAFIQLFFVYNLNKLKISKKNNIPIIDMNEKVFSVHPEPLSLLSLRKDPHVNVKANKLMVEVIANRVINDGVLDTRW